MMPRPRRKRHVLGAGEARCRHFDGSAVPERRPADVPAGRQLAAAPGLVAARARVLAVLGGRAAGRAAAPGPPAAIIITLGRILGRVRHFLLREQRQERLRQGAVQSLQVRHGAVAPAGDAAAGPHELLADDARPIHERIRRVVVGRREQEVAERVGLVVHRVGLVRDLVVERGLGVALVAAGPLVARALALEAGQEEHPARAVSVRVELSEVRKEARLAAARVAARHVVGDYRDAVSGDRRGDLRAARALEPPGRREAQAARGLRVADVVERVARHDVALAEAARARGVAVLRARREDEENRDEVARRHFLRKVERGRRA
mmetsp:Transcript_14104/g.42034  ORF Transcript_14104/g.42034 Transcript_14104/m.42034 type:complete len:321 (+) Transcript_14104:1341-2303(+)